jgi:hypothetical protein
MIKNKDFNYQTFTADNIEVDKNKVLKVVAAQPSKLTINGLSEFIDMNTKDNEKYISFFGCTKEL